MRVLVIAVIAGMACAPTRVHADPANPPTTIEEKRNRVNAEDLVAADVDAMNWVCKTSLPERNVIDWATWKTAVDDKRNYVASQCGHVVTAAQGLCRSGTIAQETFAKNVRRIACRGDGRGDIKFELAGTVLVVHTFLGAKDTDKKTYDWLYANLKP